MTSGDISGRKVFLRSAEKPDETQEKRLTAFLRKRYGDGAELVCHFCKEKYHFTQDDLRRLLEQATR